MRAVIWLVAGMASLAAQAGLAQAPRRIGECTTPGRITALKGSEILVDCDSAFVYNLPGEQSNRREWAVAESLSEACAKTAAVDAKLISTLQALAALRDSIISVKSTLVDSLLSLHRIETLAYDSLKVLYGTTDSLAHASTNNTDRALHEIRMVKGMSFVAAAIGGGAVGGLAGAKGSGFSSGWGIAGAVGGLVVDALLQRLIE